MSTKRGTQFYGHPQLSREGEWMAGVLAGGDGATLAGRCAVALLGRDKTGSCRNSRESVTTQR
jgi:hypothetical protein